MKPCPFCGETIRLSAIKCRFCNEMLTGLRPGDQAVAVASVAKPSPPHLQFAPPPQGGPIQTGPAIPGAPTFIPVEPRASMIAIGLGLAGLAIWLIASAIPFHRPMSGPEQVAFCAQRALEGINCAGHWMLNPTQYMAAFIGAGLLGLAGLEQIIKGATYRAFREVTCHTCKRKVVGKKTFMGIRCPQGQHLAEQHIGKLVLLVILVILLIAMAGR